MTIPATTRKAGPFTGNGSTTAFPFTFKVFTTADVAVIVADADGIESTLTLDSDYSVTLNSDQDATPGGTVTYPISGTPLPSTDKLSIKGDVDYEQGTDIPTGGDFNPVVLENALDSLSMQIQQVQEAVSRAAVVPITSAADAADLVADIALLASKIDNLDVIFANMADITTVADDLNEPVSEINTVAGSIANVNTVGANIADVNAVAANETNVDTVAGISANVTTVAGIAANVTTVAGIAANVTSVAGNATNINAVAGNATNINAVNANKTNIDAAVANATNINAAVANETNIDTVAGIAANVTTVAGIAAAVSTVAANAAAVSTVSTNIASVNSAATNMSAIIAAPTEASNAAASAVSAANSAASAATALDSFDDRYLGSKSSDPTLDNDGNALITGALYYSTSTQSMKVYDGANWITATAAGTTSMLVYKYVATAGQTTFSGAATVGGTMSYTSGNIIVFLNGAPLDSTDYTATNGTSVVLGSAASLNDELVVVAFKSFTVADTYTQAQADAKFVDVTGDTMTGNLLVQNAAPALRVQKTGGNEYQFKADTNDGFIRSATAGVDVMQFEYGGRVTLPQGQLRFPATQNASSDANTLDDYEEGTWTPAFTGSTTNPTVTYTKQEGRYVKVGKMVLVQFDLRWSSKSGGSGTVYISGLPFTSDGGYNYGVIAEKQNVNMDSGYTYLVAEVFGNNTVIGMVQSNATSSAISLGTGNIGAGGYVIGGASYISAN